VRLRAGITTPYFDPNDIRTFNDATLLRNAGSNGAGQSIAFSEHSDAL
jgi:hypothetical protein